MKNTAFLTKKKIFFLILAALFILIPLTMFSVAQINRYLTPKDLYTENNTPQVDKVTAVPSLSPAEESPSPSISSQQKMLNMIQNRRPLSQADLLAKQRILTLFPSGQDSGTLYKTQDITIDYVHAADLFQVEIDTTNVEQAKSEAIAWFSQHGVSQQGICDYPVTFYLNFQFGQQLREQHKSFNPLPDGC